MSNCIFCKIAAKEISSHILYEDETLVCFRDIHPAAPVHVLIVPKPHYADILELNADKANKDRIMSAVMDAVEVIADQEGVREMGFRLINNCGYNGGQTIPHLHFHLIGGKKLKEHLE
ncbi:MAG: histidine triad nucleotide-binding protein [Saccharofermentanales bacterium]